MKFAVGESSNRLRVNMLLIDTMLKAVDGKLDLAEESSRAMVRLMKQLDLPERDQLQHIDPGDAQPRTWNAR